MQKEIISIRTHHLPDTTIILYEILTLLSNKAGYYRG